MSTEKEYIVVLKKGVDAEQFDAEMKSSAGINAIPNRSVEVVNARPGNKRQTHYALTENEVNVLKNDPRVEAVEIPPQHRDDLTMVKHYEQESVFYRGSGIDSSYVNWGLRRSVEKTNIFGSSPMGLLTYEYPIDGTGVDVVIQDSGIQADHPDFFDREGVTRVQQIDWYTASGLPGSQSAGYYTDLDGHGTHCAGISAGLTYGWAKNSRIYALKLSGLEGAGDTSGTSLTDAFDVIREWHINKPLDPNTGLKRPTVVNMSWGFTATVTGNPASGIYRGNPWTFGTAPYDNDTNLWLSTGIVSLINGARRIPVRVASVDAEVEDMIDAGIIVCIAAGNNYYKADIPGGADYDNEVTFSSTYNYARGSSPFSSRAFMTGNIDSTTNGGVDRPRWSSTKGPAVNIWAPGTNIMSTCSSAYDSDYIGLVTTYPGDNSYNIMSIGGTSMAAPQVAGVAALALQVNPGMSPEGVFDKLTTSSQSVIVDSGLDNDYTSQSSLMGSPNRHLLSPYSGKPVTIAGSLTSVPTIEIKDSKKSN